MRKLPANNTGQVLFYQYFWLFQLTFWFGYAITKIFAFPTSLADVFYVAIKCIVLSTLLHLFYQRLLNKGAGFLKIALISVPFSLIAALYSLSISMHLNLRGWVLHPNAWTWIGSAEAVLHTWILFLAWSAFYLGARYALNLKIQSNNLALALQRADEARARMLRYQLSPHFLFNALNGVRALVKQQPNHARDMITALAAYLRFALRAGEHSEILIEEELEAVESYLAIEKIRFEERLEFSLQTDIANPLRRVPPMLMQPLVENAVKHGMRGLQGVLRVAIFVREQNDGLLLRVSNTGKWRHAHADASATTDQAGIGLSNIASRLQQHYPNDHSLNWFEKDGWVTVEIQIGNVQNHQSPLPRSELVARS